MLTELKRRVLEANLELKQSGLVTLTWGNVSGLAAERGLVVIKPSGVPYDRLRTEHMVVVNLDGRVIEGDLQPSSDTPTHIVLYRAFPNIGGVAHTHSTYATAFAQACLELPCLGTTHADHFYGSVPLARALNEEEADENYEGKTGQAILECFADRNPLETPGVLTAHHGPFTWGPTPRAAVENSIALETCAHMAWVAQSLKPTIAPLPGHILRKHYERKHGPNATYGQT